SYVLCRSRQCGEERDGLEPRVGVVGHRARKAVPDGHVIGHEDNVHDRLLRGDRQLAIVLQAEYLLARRPRMTPGHTMIALRIEEKCTQDHGNTVHSFSSVWKV